MTNNERSSQDERFIIATVALLGTGKVRKLKDSGSSWKTTPKRVPAPYTKSFSPYICLLE
jgi:hypothetical protein